MGKRATVQAAPLSGGMLIQHLQQENARLQQQLVSMQALLNQRAEPIGTAVLDTLTRWCEMAETPGHPAQAAAVDLLKKWVQANDRAVSASSRIVVPLARNGAGSD